MLKITDRTNVPPSWPSAGIVDARTFTVGESTAVHALTHAASNRVRGLCGVVAYVIQHDGPTASWSGEFATCPTCLERGARSAEDAARGCSCGCGAGASR